MNVDGFIADNKPLINAIIQVESDDEGYASRYEPKYRYLFDVVDKKPYRVSSRCRVSPIGFRAFRDLDSVTEFHHQRTSWGPMQVMGAVAREYGYVGPMPALCGKQGEYYGAMHLMTLKKRLDRKGLTAQTDLVAAYNAGWARRKGSGEYKNQTYVDKVLKALGDGK